MAARKNSTSGAGISAEERQIEAVRLRKEGYSYRAIGEKLGISHTQAYNDIQGALEEIRNDKAAQAIELANMVLARNNDLITVYFNMAMNGDVKAAEQVRKIQSQNIRLLGADEPERLDITSDNRQVKPTIVLPEVLDSLVEKARNNLIAPEDLEEANGSS